MKAAAADRVSTALDAAQELLPDVIALTTRLAELSAPTGDEHARSQFVRDLLNERGFNDIWGDDLGDLVATLPGTQPGRPVLIAAHLDTVFGAGTDLTVTRRGKRLCGPGVGDNSLGIAAVLTLPAMLRRLGLRPAVDLKLALTVGEEGLGNLRGIRAVVDAIPDVGAAIAIEGHNLGRVTHMAVGSRRVKILATGPGGHSWGAFGQPNAIHALARIIAELDTVPLSESPKTTLSVGLIAGGVSVNTIAPTASCTVDMRSTDAAALATLADRVERIVRGAARCGIATEHLVLGERPAGTVSRKSRIVEVATDVLASLGIDAIRDASSTDANIPISLGIPAVCLGITEGGNAHREDEYIEIEPIATGLTQLLLTSLRLAEDLAASAATPASA